MQETPQRVTRAARGSSGSGRINYNQTQIINSPRTFTPPLQSRTSQPNVPSRLRQSTGTPQPIPSVLQRGGNTPQYRPPHGTNVPPQSRFPETYPPGPLPINAYPPGQPRSARYPQRPHTQAKYTTFGSRMRTGVSGLMQPIHVTGGTNEASTPGSVYNSANASHNTGMMTPMSEYGRGGRRRTRINYAEVDDNDFGDGDERNESREKKMMDDAREKEGWSWLGERTPGNRVRSRPAPLAAASLPFVPEDDLEREAQKPVLLAPIRVELDTETHRIRDYFTWNVNETLISPEDFATTFCRDLDIPVQYYRDQIATMIRQQVEEQAELLLIMDEWDGDVDAEVAAEEEAQVDAGKEKVNKEKGSVGKESGEEEDQAMEADCRVILNLDVQIFTFNLRDRIEWDLCSPLTPEQFTEAYCAEIGLTGEAKPIIAHAIHEELLKHKKDAYEAKLYGPGAVQMEERKNAPMKLREAWRDWYEKEEFGPVMVPLTEDELIQKEQERDRAARRLRRETSRFQNPTGRGSRW